MDANTLLIAGLFTLLPIFELRGGIPYGLARGGDPFLIYLLCVSLNALVAPMVFLFLSTVHTLLERVPAYRNLFSRLVERSRLRMRSKVAKYGYFGVALFVAVPLPITGAYTGALGAWVLGMEPKRACLAIAVGVSVAGIVVSLVAYYGIQALAFFVR